MYHSSPQPRLPTKAVQSSTFRRLPTFEQGPVWYNFIAKTSMPLKRPAPDPNQTGSPSESSSSFLHPSKHFKADINKALPDIKTYIVQGKLDVQTIAELFGLAERHAGGVCKDATEADVIITAISMRRRFERHVPWGVAVSTRYCDGFLEGHHRNPPTDYPAGLLFSHTNF